jgi:peptide methionine sulfoxide reductase MsrA
MKFYKAIKRQPLPQQFYTTKNQHQQYLEQNNPFNGGDE